MKLRVVLFRQWNDQELVGPVEAALVVRPIWENAVLGAAKASFAHRTHESAQIGEAMSRAPQPECALSKKKILATSLSHRIDERGQRATGWNSRATGNLRCRRAWIGWLLERVEVRPQLIQLVHECHGIARSQRHFCFDQPGFCTHGDADVRFTRGPHQLNQERAWTEIVVERRSASLIGIERFARRATANADRNTWVVGVARVET